MTISDMGVCSPAHMRALLDRIDEHLEAARGVNVHCWGGIGRTGTVIGCWLVRHGRTGGEALAKAAELFASMGSERVARHRHTGSPQTEPQRAMVRNWAAQDRRPSRHA